MKIKTSDRHLQWFTTTVLPSSAVSLLYPARPSWKTGIIIKGLISKLLLEKYSWRTRIYIKKLTELISVE